jgi:hypothetical protein
MVQPLELSRLLNSGQAIAVRGFDHGHGHDWTCHPGGHGAGRVVRWLALLFRSRASDFRLEPLFSAKLP